jgi:hypothetical protein
MVEVWLHTFLNLALVGCVWSASFSKLFYHLYASTYHAGWILEHRRKTSRIREIFLFCRESKPESLGVQPHSVVIASSDVFRFFQRSSCLNMLRHSRSPGGLATRAIMVQVAALGNASALSPVI